MAHITLGKILNQNYILKEANFLYNNQKLEKLVVYWDLLKSIRLIMPERKLSNQLF